MFDDLIVKKMNYHHQMIFPTTPNQPTDEVNPPSPELLLSPPTPKSQPDMGWARLAKNQNLQEGC